MKKGIRKGLRAGFTLVELLLVISIIGILGTIAVVNFGDVGGKARVTTTQATMQGICKALEVYKMRTVSKGKYPKTLDVLTVGIDDDPPTLQPGDLNDAWGNPFDYKAEGKKFSLRSAGPDEQMNTEDDLTN